MVTKLRQIFNLDAQMDTLEDDKGRRKRKRQFGTIFHTSAIPIHSSLGRHGNGNSHNNCYRPSHAIPTEVSTCLRLPSKRIVYRKKVITLCRRTHAEILCERGRATTLYIFQTPAISLPIRELTQLNKQDNTNFHLLGGHDVEVGDVDMSVILCLNYL